MMKKVKPTGWLKFGDWVYDKLIEYEKSVNWLAKEVGCSHSAFLDYRSGDRQPSVAIVMGTVKAIAEVGNMSEERVLLEVARDCYGVGV
jgi:hypothetical protein